MTAALPFSPADTARTASAMYTISLAAIVPLAIAMIAAFATRRMPAGTRALVWKGAVTALFGIYVAQQLPAHWSAWIMPSVMAEPLVALGRAQVARRSGDGAIWVRLLVGVYWAGVLMVLSPVLLQLLRRHRGGVRTPQTRGVFRPTIALPAYMRRWTNEQIRVVLLHERNHIRQRDPLFALVARVTCALYWFNPGVWWTARALERECELACDDAVLSAGVKPSAYAEILATAAECAARAGGGDARLSLAMALSGDGRATLRARLRQIVDTRRDIRGPTRPAFAIVAALTLIVSASMGTVRLVPTREVLTSLMRDSRWESRAFAVIGLAQRQDSVAVAREAARLDPSPDVRAWARYALTELR